MFWWSMSSVLAVQSLPQYKDNHWHMHTLTRAFKWGYVLWPLTLTARHSRLTIFSSFLFILDLLIIQDSQSAPVDLESYVKKLNNSRRRVMLVNNILQNVQVVIEHILITCFESLGNSLLKSSELFQVK